MKSAIARVSGSENACQPLYCSLQGSLLLPDPGVQCTRNKQYINEHSTAKRFFVLLVLVLVLVLLVLLLLAILPLYRLCVY